MLKRISFSAVMAMFVLGFGFADQSRKIVIPVNKTNPTDAKQMYSSYCAPCHGTDGKGSGPVARDLKTIPTDLTTLALKHDGRFPDVHVVSVLRFGVNVSAHGSAAMPVWGRLLGNMDPVNSMATDLRIANLTHYLESMQVK